MAGKPEDLIEALERLNIAKAKYHYAMQKANVCAIEAKIAERAYVGAGNELRDREREFEAIAKPVRKWWTS